MAKWLLALISVLAGAASGLLPFAQKAPKPAAAPALKIPAMWEYTAPLI